MGGIRSQPHRLIQTSSFTAETDLLGNLCYQGHAVVVFYNSDWLGTETQKGNQGRRMKLCMVINWAHYVTRSRLLLAQGAPSLSRCILKVPRRKWHTTSQACTGLSFVLCVSRIIQLALFRVWFFLLRLLLSASLLLWVVKAIHPHFCMVVHCGNTPHVFIYSLYGWWAFE